MQHKITGVSFVSQVFDEIRAYGRKEGVELTQLENVRTPCLNNFLDDSLDAKTSYRLRMHETIANDEMATQIYERLIGSTIDANN